MILYFLVTILVHVNVISHHHTHNTERQAIGVEARAGEAGDDVTMGSVSLPVRPPAGMSDS